jgi:hypothetical protein
MTKALIFVSGKSIDFCPPLPVPTALSNLVDPSGNNPKPQAIKRMCLLAKDLAYIFLIKIIRTNWKPVPVMKLTENAFWTKERNKNRCVM